MRGLVTWPKDVPPEGGCTALVGMCHLLPGVLIGNLRCLNQSAWPELKEVIVVVDSTRGCLPSELEAQARAVCSNFRLRFEYYSQKQAQRSEEVRLPYVFSWLSWSIGISLCRTKHALLHDYDALILDDTLARRYDKFVADRSFVQGIKWYKGNGVETSDQLATTFEAFFDVAWVRAFQPVAMFNQVAYWAGRSFDYDTLLDIQHRSTARDKRSLEPMPESSMVHPSQMIHQFTMFRRDPAKLQPCFSIPMIPFFEWLSGNAEALKDATQRLKNRAGTMTDFFGNNVPINLGMLSRENVDWDLKQMIRACQGLDISPSRDLYNYGNELYALCGAADAAWVGDFTTQQRDWIDRSLAAGPA